MNKFHNQNLKTYISINKSDILKTKVNSKHEINAVVINEYHFFYFAYFLFTLFIHDALLLG